MQRLYKTADPQNQGMTAAAGIRMKKTLTLHACALVGLLVAPVDTARASSVAVRRLEGAPMKSSDVVTLSKSAVAGGVVHELPADLRDALIADAAARARWELITPLARNEWICWVESAKRAETRATRLARLREELKAGKNRPCCWPGCPHRTKNGR